MEQPSAVSRFLSAALKCCVWFPESELGQRDVGALCESVLSYLRDLPSPIIPPCIYPQLQTTVALQQQVQLQAAGNSEHPVST